MVIFLAVTDLRAGYQVPVGAGAFPVGGVRPPPLQQLHLLLGGSDLPPQQLHLLLGGSDPPPQQDGSGGTRRPPSQQQSAPAPVDITDITNISCRYPALSKTSRVTLSGRVTLVSPLPV